MAKNRGLKLFLSKNSNVSKPQENEHVLRSEIQKNNVRTNKVQ